MKSCVTRSLVVLAVLAGFAVASPAPARADSIGLRPIPSDSDCNSPTATATTAAVTTIAGTTGSPGTIATPGWTTAAIAARARCPGTVSIRTGPAIPTPARRRGTAR